MLSILYPTIPCELCGYFLPANVVALEAESAMQSQLDALCRVCYVSDLARLLDIALKADPVALVYFSPVLYSYRSHITCSKKFR